MHRFNDDATPRDEGSALTDGVDPDAPAIEEPARRKLTSTATVKINFGTPRTMMRGPVASNR